MTRAVFLFAVVLSLSKDLCCTAETAPPVTTILIATNPAGPWTAVYTNSSSTDFFAKLQLSNASSASLSIGNVITVSNSSPASGVATATLTNGIGYATITLSSNDWAALTGATGIHSNQWRITIKGQ
jgi:hypothetical protein